MQLQNTKHKQKVLNFYAGPGTGKSTVSALSFALLKMQGYNVELVREYAKELVWEHGCIPEWISQEGIFNEQYKRIQILSGKVDIIITDSPLLMSTVYGTSIELAKNRYDEFDNIDIGLIRSKKYNPSGRLQTEDEAKTLDETCHKFCSTKIHTDMDSVRGFIDWLVTYEIG